ncbi:MAG: hypothetical protein ACOC8B_01550 [Gemmatimonadota bacterium]
MSYSLVYGLLGLLWIAASAVGGALLALLARRMHPALSFRRLWVFYSALLAIASGALFAIGIF